MVSSLKSVVIAVILWLRSVTLVQIIFKLRAEQCIWTDELAHFFIVLPFSVFGVDYLFKIINCKAFVPSRFDQVFCFSGTRTIVFASRIVEIIYYLDIWYYFFLYI